MVNKMAKNKTAISSYIVKERLQQIFLYVWLVLACVMVFDTCAFALVSFPSITQGY